MIDYHKDINDRQNTRGDEDVGITEEEYEKVYMLLIRYAQVLLKNWDDARDIVQEALVLAVEKSKLDLQSEEGKRWLYCTIKNMCKKEWRKVGNGEKAMDRYIQEEIPENSQADDWLEEDIESSYPGITKDENYKIVSKVFIEEYSIQECAEEWKCSYEAAKKRIQRAKKALKKKLEQYRKEKDDE